ncbi:MAG: hypothetical protein E6R02_07255 [Gammaproteobacteria bacterium]|nr:MAG: hypothetical protein E6R02_07255 [Gammaproteobacteria bacterium]
MTASHDDLHRDIGRMEGRLGAVEQRLEKMEAVLERIDERLAKIEVQENERKGAWRVLVFVSGVLSSGVAAVVTWFFK